MKAKFASHSCLGHQGYKVVRGGGQNASLRGTGKDTWDQPSLRQRFYSHN